MILKSGIWFKEGRKKDEGEWERGRNSSLQMQTQGGGTEWDNAQEDGRSDYLRY